WSAPRRMIEPLPNCFSIELTASSIAFSRWSAIGILAGRPLFYLTGLTFSPWGSGLEGDSEQRYVLRSFRFCYPFIQNDFSHRGRAKVRLRKRADPLRQAAPPLAHARHGDMRVKRPRLACEPQLGRRRVDRLRQLLERAVRVGHADPQDAGVALVG